MIIRNLYGVTHISTIALSKLVGAAAKATVGIASIPAGLLEGISNYLSGNSLQNGIELKAEESSLKIHIRIVVAYGTKVQEVCNQLRSNITQSVEQLSGLTVSAINISVEGVALKEASR